MEGEGSRGERLLAGTQRAATLDASGGWDAFGLTKGPWTPSILVR